MGESKDQGIQNLPGIPSHFSSSVESFDCYRLTPSQFAASPLWRPHWHGAGMHDHLMRAYFSVKAGTFMSLAPLFALILWAPGVASDEPCLKTTVLPEIPSFDFVTIPQPIRKIDPTPSIDSRIPAIYQQTGDFSKDALNGSDSSCASIDLQGAEGFSYCLNDQEFPAFSLANRGSPRINPIGGNVRREFTFSSPHGARQDTGLYIFEWGTPDEGASDSAWSMSTEIQFFPRKKMSSVREIIDPSGKDAYEVTIPTGEKILFDKETKEITAGPLVETSPIDMSTNRQTRKFAGLRYDGTGIMVRADQRGETPRSSVVWGARKFATVTWGKKTCRVPTGDIWQQDAQKGGGAGRYAKDEDFYAMLRTKCGWNVSAGKSGL